MNFIFISVLVSIYNEKPSEIQEAFQSVFRQTYTNFEVVVINDNPKRKEEIEKLFRQDDLRDSRVKLYHNEENIGLALTMNRASELASAQYLVRMDADDICEHNRFEVIVSEMLDGDYNLVCSRFSFIDEDGKSLDKVSPYLGDERLDAAIKKWNVIHHPTVIMRREAFEKAGKYRNYPCSQDYDLWLRMMETSGKMHMVDAILLKYRVRGNSISVSKSMQQLYTIEYIKKLAKQRERLGKDDYSLAHYQQYLQSHGVFNERRNQRFVAHNNMHKQAQTEMRNGRTLKALRLYFRALISEPLLLKQMLDRKM